MTRMFRIVSMLSFTEDERMQYRKLIRRAVVSAMQLLLTTALEAEVPIEHQVRHRRRPLALASL
jgi:hypothetical protein